MSYVRVMRHLPAFGLLATACNATATVIETDPADPDWAPSCPAGVSDLDGVCFALPAPSVTFTLAEAAAGVTIPWAIVVDNPAVRVVTPIPQDAGGCGVPGPSGLIPFVSVGGGGQGWCLCDVGLCPATRTPVPLVDGVHREVFAWGGRNWTGPSDFGNPEGAPFPPGTYTLEIRAAATVDDAPVSVSNTMTVVLTP